LKTADQKKTKNQGSKNKRKEKKHQRKATYFEENKLDRTSF
jgi:hypothetical protein